VGSRGNSAEFPENTLPALRSAIALGVRFIELDVHLRLMRSNGLQRDSVRSGDGRKMMQTCRERRCQRSMSVRPTAR